MDILYKPPFKKFVKKQSRAFQLAIEDEVEGVRNTPDMERLKRRLNRIESA